MGKMTDRYEACQGVYIDPIHTNSSVRWKLVGGMRNRKVKAQVDGEMDTIIHAISVNGEVGLTDCSRSISWSFDGSKEEALKKLDKAIGALTAFRSEMVDVWDVLETKAESIKRDGGVVRKSLYEGLGIDDDDDIDE